MEKSFTKPIYVTKPFLPPLTEYKKGLNKIWKNCWLTNNGPILNEYTQKLEQYLKTDNVCLFSNGTLALQLGLKGMCISGEVITTPFTFVATAHALHSNNITPVFVDIEPEYYTLDPAKVEQAITPLTTAILAVHVFGYPCKLKELSEIAKKHNLKLIYDAAHSFGVEVDGIPISNYGDLSMFSFHSTKLYHSIEGGLLTFTDSTYKTTFNYLKNFGIKNECEVVMHGTNAKMNEFQALMGMLNLNYIDGILEKRKLISEAYRSNLKDTVGIIFTKPLSNNIKGNYSYIPIQIVEGEFPLTRDELYEELKKYNVFCRRYFYPLVSDFSCYQAISENASIDIARKVASQILCLPTYYDLDIKSVNKICNIIKEISLNAKR